MFRWQRYFSKTAVIMESGGQDLEAQCPTTMLCVGGFVITVGYIGLFNCDKQFLFAEKRANLKIYQSNPKGAVSLKWSSCKIMMLFKVVKFCSIRIKNNKESYVNQDMYVCIHMYTHILMYTNPSSHTDHSSELFITLGALQKKDRQRQNHILPLTSDL